MHDPIEHDRPIWAKAADDYTSLVVEPDRTFCRGIVYPIRRSRAGESVVKTKRLVNLQGTSLADRG